MKLTDPCCPTHPHGWHVTPSTYHANPLTVPVLLLLTYLCSKEVSREIHSHRPLDMLQDMAYCPAVSRVAVGGGSTIKLLDVGAEYGEVSNEAMELPVGHMVNKLGWGQDGQVGLSQPTSPEPHASACVDSMGCRPSHRHKQPRVMARM